MKMTEQIAEPIEFQLPSGYRSARALGIFERAGPTELQLTDFFWLPLQAIAKQFAADLHGGVVPFARSGDGDVFGWSYDDVNTVFFAPVDSEPVFYAADFEAFLYRVLLEEFSMSALVARLGIDATAARFRRYAEQIGSLLPTTWAKVLRDLSRRPLEPTGIGFYSVLSRDEADRLIFQAAQAAGRNDL